MPNYNLTVIAGHLTRDPQLSFTPSNTAVCKCGIASTHKYGDREDTCFVDFTIFGKQAETFNKYMNKGAACLIQGRLHLNQWAAQDGTKRSKHEIIVDKFTFLGKTNGQQQQPEPAQPQTPGPGTGGLPEDPDIPF